MGGITSTQERAYCGLLTLADVLEPEDIPIFTSTQWLNSYLLSCYDCGAQWAMVRLYTLDEEGGLRRLEYVPAVMGRCRACGDGGLVQFYPFACGRIPMPTGATLREIDICLGDHRK